MADDGRTLTLDVFARRKRAGRKLVVLTAYDLASARIAARGGADALLVGDSLGMVVMGHGTTLPVGLAEMIHHTAAVVRAKPQLPVIADMPYGSFHVEPARTVEAGLRLVKEAGASAVKVEGGRARAAHLAALLTAEIPVMGHLGLTPQSVNRFGGWKVQGRGAAAAEQLRQDARYLQEAGCFALVLECIPADLAAAISRELVIPTVGIGAGAGCDGQVLVFHDLLGLGDEPLPRFVKRYAELGRAGTEAVARWAADVRGGVFPGPEHTYADADAPAAA
ncbi:MAG: 3-methyl-2-oxobutanoate hydroxymethyltransferase, partial [Krumholzibacteria bacterium]|nr:3-methyl-2-oxobutanoate hydroxymethyltransferase [Candidatus Krumholzibacteria bacterium]